MSQALLRVGMLVNGMRLWRQVHGMTSQPDRAQWAALERILQDNRETRFGREHGFASIDSVEAYQRQVPVSEYEALRPFIEEQRTTGAPSLTAEPPLFYAQTSGSTAAPKLIPVTPTSLQMHKREQALFSYLQYRVCPEAFHGRAWGIMGAAVEGTLDSGHHVGSVSGHLYQSLPRGIRARFVIPPIVSTIADYDVKYRTILCLALAEPTVTYMGTPNPSTFLRLLTLLNSERERLLDVVATGRTAAIEGLPAGVATQLPLRAGPDRAAALSRLERLTFANVWPGIRLVTTWTGGSCGIAVDALRRELPEGAAIMELGYQATECRGTIALEPNTSAGLPALHHTFFEFVEQSAWDAGDRNALTLGQLEEGRRYHVIITTAAGLYRYFMNDLLEVTGFHERTPLFRFVQKGKGVTSLTGEKLYESQVIAAVQEGARAVGVMPAFFLVAADEATNGYELLIEVEGRAPFYEEGSAPFHGEGRAPLYGAPDWTALAAAVDERLGQINLEYHSKRASGRLRPLAVRPLRAGASEAHKAAYLRAGQRESQFKPVILQYRRDLRWQPDEYVVG